MKLLTHGDYLFIRAYDGGNIAGEFKRDDNSWEYYFYFGPASYCNSWMSRRIGIDPDRFGSIVPEYHCVLRSHLWLFSDRAGASRLYWLIKSAIESGEKLDMQTINDDYERKMLGLCMK